MDEEKKRKKVQVMKKVNSRKKSDTQKNLLVRNNLKVTWRKLKKAIIRIFGAGMMITPFTL
jgi:hypothetical protein